jgi:hypothetical protein
MLLDFSPTGKRLVRFRRARDPCPLGEILDPLSPRLPPRRTTHWTKVQLRARPARAHHVPSPPARALDVPRPPADSLKGFRP